MLTKERIDELVLLDKGRVDISVYTDEEIFEEEMQRIFYTTWIYVGHESEVPEAGTYVRKSLGRQPVILTQDDVEAVRQRELLERDLRDVCSGRRGAILLRGDRRDDGQHGDQRRKDTNANYFLHGQSFVGSLFRLAQRYQHATDR